MRALILVLPILFLSCPFLIAQADATNAPVRIYASGQDVTLPQLLASPQGYPLGNCRPDMDGILTFSLIVDASGQPRNIYFLSPIGDDLDLIALRQVIADRFTPGMSAGQPVAVAVSLEMKLHACLAQRKDAGGKTQQVLELTSLPTQELKLPVNPPQQAVLVSGSGLSANPADPDAGIEKVGGDVKPPIHFEPAESLFREQRAALGRGDYKVSLVVDRYGLPERLKIIESAMPGREQAIASTFRLHRWKPAMKDGEPVPSRVQVEIDNR
jgi:hypothetical protein